MKVPIAPVENPTRDELAWERGELCDVCCLATGIQRISIGLGVERHHGLFKRMKGVSVLDEKYNLFLVCKYCHDERVWGWDLKRKLWKLQVRRYGHEIMLDWYRRVPLKGKDRYDLVEV